MRRSATLRNNPSGLPPSKQDQAALAFSLLSTQCAAAVNRRLSIGERMRLREGLSRVRDATDEQRNAAMRMLAREVKNGTEWPRPSMHDEADCPFNVIASHTRERTIDVFERVAAREPLEIAVALCHMPAQERDEIWADLTPAARNSIVPILDAVHLVSNVATRSYARDIEQRLGRAMRRIHRRGALG